MLASLYGFHAKLNAPQIIFNLQFEQMQLSLPSGVERLVVVTGAQSVVDRNIAAYKKPLACITSQSHMIEITLEVCIACSFIM